MNTHLSETRFHPLNNQPIIFSCVRGKRPHLFGTQQLKTNEQNACPLCEGNEHETPPEIAAIGEGEKRKPNTPGWKIRVVPNKFPAISPCSCDNKTKKLENNFFRNTPGYGYHEVIITKDHNRPLSLLAHTEMSALFAVYQQRTMVLKKDKKIQYIQIIYNQGKAAGASLPHPHSQLFAINFIPETIKKNEETIRVWGKKQKNHLMETLIKSEALQKKRIICMTPSFTAWCPYASRVPYEICIAPKKQNIRFEDTNESLRNELAKITQVVLYRVYKKLKNPDYNLSIITTPIHSNKKWINHWHIEILPRFSIFAGFELATGACINSVYPEDAAKILKID